MSQSLCKTCKNAIWDSRWGDFKCKVYQYYIYGKAAKCKHYAEGKPEESKANKEYEEGLEC